MKILITGVDGFIGRSLKDYLQKQGHDISGTTYFNLPQDNEVFFDITDPAHFHRLPEGYDIIIHTIGIIDQTVPFKRMNAVTVRGTERLLQWAKERKCRHFIYTSSVSVYGLKTMGINRTERNTKRYSGCFAIPYMRTKAKAEAAIEASRIPYTILRLPPVIGGNDSFFSSTIISYLVCGSFFFCGTRDYPVSLLYVKNLGPLMNTLLAAGPQYSAFNCCDSHPEWSRIIAEYASHLFLSVPQNRKSFVSLFPRLYDKQYLLLLTFSRFGAHFPDSMLHDAVPHTHPYSWKDGVKEAVGVYSSGL
ncbi:MAG: NAD(P)-dependent oxidoreductase [Spirochaetales bacterium]|nr:NAD(P)-dependent oxidoreductase [Spirochaetales bacterium]